MHARRKSAGEPCGFFFAPGLPRPAASGISGFLSGGTWKADFAGVGVSGSSGCRRARLLENEEPASQIRMEKAARAEA